MRKIFTTTLVLALAVANAQITLTPDPNFGNNGLVEINNVHPQGFLLNYFFTNDKIVVSYHGEEDNDPQTNDGNTKFLRINSNGTIDPSFGLNGSIIVPLNEAYSFYAADSYVYMNGGKKYLANGTLDPAFGNNGALNVSSNYQYFKVLPDGKILERTEDSFCKYTSSGNFDTTFGNGGCQSITSSVPIPQYGIYEGLIKDNFAHEYDSGLPSPSLKYIRKLNINSGDLDTSYGNNGYGIVSDIPMYLYTYWFNKNDSSVINMVTENNSYPQTSDFFFTKTKPDGNLDLSFGNAGKINIGSNIVFNGDTYTNIMISGDGDKIFILEEDASPLDNPNVNKIGIRCYSYSGNNMLINNSTMFPIEIPISNLSELEPKFMEVRGNYLYLLCSKKIFRYLINESTLSVSENLNTTSNLTFENPFKDELLLKTNEKIKEIELYDEGGRVVLKGKETKLNTSSLVKGVYFIKITTESNQIISKKGIKN